MGKEKQFVNAEPIPEEVAKIVRTLAADSDLKVEFNLPPNATVHFLGQPILAFNPITNNATLPARFLHHRLIENRYFFALPRAFWDEVCQQIGADAFDAELMDLDYAAAEICRDFSLTVGLYKGSGFAYHLLQPSAGRHVSAKDANSVGWKVSQAALDFAVRIGEEHLRPFTRVARGYAGWLLTNRHFLDEHDSIFAQWSDMVRRWGLAKLGILVPTGMFIPGDDPTTNPKWSDYSKAFGEFFTRWRLRGMAAPYLPIPLEPLMAGDLAVSLLPQLARAEECFACLIPFRFPAGMSCGIC